MEATRHHALQKFFYQVPPVSVSSAVAGTDSLLSPAPGVGSGCSLTLKCAPCGTFVSEGAGINEYRSRMRSLISRCSLAERRGSRDKSRRGTFRQRAFLV